MARPAPSARPSISPPARPGAARSLPAQLISRVPVLRRMVPSASPEPVPASTRLQRLLPRPVASLLLNASPAPQRRGGFAFVAPVLRGVKQPLARTAAVVQMAREVRKPRSRWERLRDAAQRAAREPRLASRWEQWMGLGLALAAPPSAPARRSRVPLLRVLAQSAPPPPPPPLVTRVARRWRDAVLGSRVETQEKAGSRKSGNRPGSARTAKARAPRP